MASTTLRLIDKGLLEAPTWFNDGMKYEAMIGSIAYGCNQEGDSDVDIGGFVIPPAYMVFPHMTGHIAGFGERPKEFEQLQQHHVKDKERNKSYDICIYGIVKFFQLCRDNNPNMIDMLFVPDRCIKLSSKAWERVREQRKLFLHKECWWRFRGYANEQLKKIDSGANRENPKRQQSIDEFGYDVKFAYHIVRLVLECEQILLHGDLILDRDREVYKSIRRGEWTLGQIRDWFAEKKQSMENLYTNCKLREEPDDDSLRSLLHECLEEHYGTLDNYNKEMKYLYRYNSLVEQIQELAAHNSFARS